MKKHGLILLCWMIACSIGASSLKVVNLTCEYMQKPLGIDVRNPLLSWQLQSDERGVFQSAYEIWVATDSLQLETGKGLVWKSGKVKSTENVNLAYAGKGLRPFTRYYWKVRAYDRAGDVSAWSETAWWETAMLADNDWKAEWISDGSKAPEKEVDFYKDNPAPMFRKVFHVKDDVACARLYIAGIGYYEASLNGEKVGDHWLDPGWTNYAKEILYSTYDVTSCLKKGTNCMGVILGNGFYNPIPMPIFRNLRKYLTIGQPCLRAQLRIVYKNGKVETLGSDADWTCSKSPILRNNVYLGEHYDAREEKNGWNTSLFQEKEGEWKKAIRVETPPVGRLTPQMQPPVRIREVIRPKRMTETRPGEFVFDMGQNFAGVVRIKVKGEKGTQIKIRYGEDVYSDGSLNVMTSVAGQHKTIWNADWKAPGAPQTAWQEDSYILKGEGIEEWAPRFVYHGFRYVEVSEFPGTPTLANFTGEVVNDDMPLTGTFECDNPILNQLVKNAFWGIRGNYKGIPLDCPQRDERQPWLGDHTNGALGESFLMENGPLYAKWMDDIRDAQREDGCIPDVVPAYYYYYTDNVTWPSTFIFISNMLYEQYGNPGAICKHYPAMKQWMEHIRTEFMNQSHIITRDRYGDWCLPPESPELIHSKDPARITDGKLIATAYYYKLLQYMIKFAQLQLDMPHTPDIAGQLHHQQLAEDIQEYRELAEHVKEGFNKTFWNQEKQYYSNNTVTANLLPLAFDMVPDTEKETVARQIIHKTVDYYNATIQCGVIGVQWLMRELVRMGRTDVAYVLATHTKYPGWGYMAANGATTIWELWNGNTADPAMNSGNHVMLLGDFLPYSYQHLAGIRNATPGFKEIQMKPAFELEEVGFIRASHITPYGKVTSNWSQTATGYSWEISVPANSTATIWLPNADTYALTVN